MPLVVKVGGSLYDWPDLRPKLARWLRENAISMTLVVPGGGRFADLIRSLNRTHDLGDETAHWLAIQSLDLAGEFLRSLLHESSAKILDITRFSRGDEANPSALPHTWNVTSDSIAARVAEVNTADLVLLKSSEPPPGTETDWAAAGYVDPFFPTIVERAKLSVRAVNLRTY